MPVAGTAGSDEYQRRVQAVQEAAGALAAQQQRMWAAQQAVSEPGRQAPGGQGFSSVPVSGYPGQAGQAVSSRSSVLSVPVPAPASNASTHTSASASQSAVGQLRAATVTGPVPASAGSPHIATVAAARPVIRSEDDELRQWAMSNESSPALQLQLASMRMAAVRTGIEHGVKPESAPALKEMTTRRPSAWTDPINLGWLKSWKEEEERGLSRTAAASHQQQFRNSGCGQASSSGPGR